MKKTAFIIMFITILSKIFGFGREVSLTYYYGASSISDAYLISMTIPSVIFGFITYGLGAGYIPIYSEVLQKKGNQEADKFTSSVANILFVFCTVVIIFVFFYANQIVKVFASGFEGDTLDLTIKFSKINLMAIYFAGAFAVFSGYLQVKGNYIVPALVGIPLNFFLIVSIILSQQIDNVVLSIGYVIAIASQFIFMIPFLKKEKFKYDLVFKFKDKHIKNLIHIIAPLTLGVSVNHINTLVDRTLASKIAIGGISSLNYASRLNEFIQGIFVLSIITVLYPTLSKMAAERNMDGFQKSLIESLTGISLFIIPATIGTMLFSSPIVSLLFGRGAFDFQALNMTSDALFFYSLGMIGVGFREVLARAFYSLQDAKTPMINASAGMFLNIVLNIVLSKYLGIGGLALATSIAATVTTIFLFISLRKKIGPFGMKTISVSFIKILFASLIMGGLSKFSFNYLTTYFSQNFSLLLAICIGAVVYFIIIYFMKINEVDLITEAMKKKFGK